MKKIRSVLLAAAALAPMGAIALAPGAKATARRSVVNLPILGVQTHGAAQATSLNWSGYVVPAPASHQITGVHTRFSVPAAHSQSPGGAALWTGIGGHTTTDLIQAGVSVGDILSGANYAWYEMLPNAEIPITSGCSGDATCAVNTGDTVQVDIVHKTGDTWVISLNDFNHWTWAHTVHYTSTFSSAEWILEAPSLVALPMFVPFVDDTTFSHNTFAVDNGTPKVIGSGNAISYGMAILGVVPEASPSALAADGDRFRACAYKSSCAQP